MTKSNSTRFTPLTEGLLLAALVIIAIVTSLSVIYALSKRAMEGEIKAGLSRQVAVLARMLDGELGDQHKLFTPAELAAPPTSLPEVQKAYAESTTSQAVYGSWQLRLKLDDALQKWRVPMLQSDLYNSWAQRLERVRKASEDTRFAYTNVRIRGRIYFGANLTPQEDSDGDGAIDEPPALLWPYPDHAQALIEALDTDRVTVTPTPYQDLWGEYYSGYAPFHDSQGQIVGTVGMDLALDSFNRRMAPIFFAVQVSASCGLLLALLCGWIVYQSRSRQARIAHQLEEEHLLLAEANGEITKLNHRLSEENLRMSAELDITRQLQTMTLPKSADLNIARDSQLEIAAYVAPADEVGGDYYDVLYDSGYVHIGIGDVTGHGLESGVLMLMAQTAIRTLLCYGETDPLKLMHGVNRVLYQQITRMRTDKNMTLALLNYHSGTLTITGQHEEVIVIREDGRVERIDTQSLGFFIGMVDEIDLASLTIQLEPGDVLALYTDGIPEAESPAGELYGMERLCDILQAGRHDLAEEIKDAVIADVRRHISTQKVHDDITLVIAKRLPRPMPLT